MDQKQYLRELGKLSGSRMNELITYVNYQAAKDKVKFNDEVEEMFFDRLMEEAKEHEKKWGDWPSFAMCEIETDDPVLDIYND